MLWKNYLLWDKNIRTKNNDLMQEVVKLLMNSLYGVQIRRNNNESYYCKSKTWLKTEVDEIYFLLFYIVLYCII